MSSICTKVSIFLKDIINIEFTHLLIVSQLITQALQVMLTPPSHKSYSAKSHILRVRTGHHSQVFVMLRLWRVNDSQRQKKKMNIVLCGVFHIFNIGWDFLTLALYGML